MLQSPKYCIVYVQSKLSHFPFIFLQLFSHFRVKLCSCKNTFSRLPPYTSHRIDLFEVGYTKDFRCYHYYGLKFPSPELKRKPSEAKHKMNDQLAFAKNAS
jgi:hypothetical protein